MTSRKTLCVCKRCETKFYVFNSQIRKGGGKYCSRECKDKSQTNGRIGKYTKERYNKIQSKLRDSLMEQYPDLFDKDYLEYHYYIEQYSLQELADKIGCSVQALKSRFKEFEIEIRTLKESKNTERYLDKYRGENN